MFDQTTQSKNENTSVSATQQIKKQVSPPSNLPGVDTNSERSIEPKPISEKPAPSSSQQLMSETIVPQKPQVEDMFSETESPNNSQISRPTQPGQASQMPVSEGDVFGGRSILDNKILLAVIIIIGLAIVGGIAWLVIGLFNNNSLVNTNTNANIDNNINTNNNTDVNINENINNNNNINVNTNTNTNATTDLNTNNDIDSVNENSNINNNTVPFKDSDNDGLSDEEEIKLGTDPYNWDTDGDGLSDYAEIYIYGSDPLKKDTDGDGYDDGDEVMNGFDPTKGGGARLFDIP